MKKIYILPSCLALAILLQSGRHYSSVPPGGFTGATGLYCNSCHAGALNSGGGSITVSGLPTTGYVPGQSYPFSLTITHGAANRTRWGFSVAARNANGDAVGTFSSTNPNAAVNGNTDPTNQELSHYYPSILTASASYTYNNLVWTAPATPPTGGTSVTFYYVGNAANGNGGTSGDFTYSGSTTLALPIELKNFTATVRNNSVVGLQWVTSSESNSDYFAVEKSEDNQFFRSLGRVAAAGNSTAEKSYSYTDVTVTSYNKPVYYRLKLMDKDGRFKLSKVVSVQLSSHKNFVENLYPSIVNNNMLVTAEITSDKAQPVQIQLVDLNGRTLKIANEQLTSGNNVIGFRMPENLPAQWVFARFAIGSTRQTIPLIVHP